MIYKTFLVKKTFPWKQLNLVENQQGLIMPVGDIHYGTPDWPKQKFVDHLKWGMDRGAYFLGMGEPTDFASFSQRAQIAPLRDSVREQLDDMIKAQLDEFVDLVYFTNGRWIGMVEGDHRWEFSDATSGDQYLCRALGCDFLGTSALITLQFEDAPVDRGACVTIYAHHGIGSSRTLGGHLARVGDLVASFEADIYMMGHSHAKIATPRDRYYLLPDGKICVRTKWFVRTGGWLSGYICQEPLDLDAPVIESRGTYVELKSLAPSEMGGLVIGVGYEQVPGSEYFKNSVHISV